MSEISRKITKTIAWQSSPSKRSKAYRASSKAKLISLRQIFLNCFPLIVAQFGTSGGLSSSVESQASLRMANFDLQFYPLSLSPGIHEDYSDWSSSATHFWVAKIGADQV